MAKNDVVLLDGILKERVAAKVPSDDIGEVFELFALEQVLKDFDLSRDDIESGWIDGQDDGGIDAFYVFVNGHLVRDPENFSWPKRSATLEVYVVTCKHRDSFQLPPVTLLHSTLSDFLDFSRPASELAASFSEDVLEARERVIESYKALANVSPAVSFRFFYACRGSEVAPNIKAKSEEVERIAKEPFSQCETSFEFMGAAELVASNRRTKKFSLELQVSEHLASRDGASHLVLASLQNYFEFVRDETGLLRRYLFDSNVRDFMGDNPVNLGIRESLSAQDAPEFWWLNNGITILATSVTAIGRKLHLADIQIVNGLQTTESIFQHFSSGSNRGADRCVLIKVLVSENSSTRDQIIRATNSQTAVESLALRATEKIQRDIEEVLARDEWYYERRTNYYKNIGRPEARFVTPVFLAGAHAAVVQKNLLLAATMRTKTLRRADVYDSIFSDVTPLTVWPKITHITKVAQEVLASARPKESHQERFQARWRPYVALLMTGRLLGRFSYGVSDLERLDIKTATPTLAEEAWALVVRVRGRMPQNSTKEFSRLAFAEQVCLEAASVWGTQHPEAVVRRCALVASLPRRELDDDLLARVDAALPAQPWPPRVHRDLAQKLGIAPGDAYLAISTLIQKKKRHRQKDGVVTDASGKVLAVDKSRVKS